MEGASVRDYSSAVFAQELTLAKRAGGWPQVFRGDTSFESRRAHMRRLITQAGLAQRSLSRSKFVSFAQAFEQTYGEAL